MSDADAKERQELAEVMRPYAGQINDTSALWSLLYYLDLLPEQIARTKDAARLMAICLLFRQLTPAQLNAFIASTNEPPKQ